jgi:hypothetical protein
MPLGPRVSANRPDFRACTNSVIWFSIPLEIRIEIHFIESWVYDWADQASGSDRGYELLRAESAAFRTSHDF